jgi:hypothetical protein
MHLSITTKDSQLNTGSDSLGVIGKLEFLALLIISPYPLFSAVFFSIS